jgi:single-strand DNA-binding protein
MLNHITIHGRLTADPELKQTQSGVSVCNFTVAVDRSYKNGEEKQTDFFTAVCWRGLADMVSKYFAKGKEIIVSGEMQSRKWQDNEGNNRISWEIIANGVDFCGSKSDNGSNSAPTYQANNAPKFEEIDENSDLPF